MEAAGTITISKVVEKHQWNLVEKRIAEIEKLKPSIEELDSISRSLIAFRGPNPYSCDGSGLAEAEVHWQNLKASSLRPLTERKRERDLAIARAALLQMGDR